MSYIIIFFILTEAGVYTSSQMSSYWPELVQIAVGKLSFTIFFTVITEVSSLPSPCQLTHAVMYSQLTQCADWLIIESMLAFQTEADTRGNSSVQSDNFHGNRDTFYPLKQYVPLY